MSKSNSNKNIFCHREMQIREIKNAKKIHKNQRKKSPSGREIIMFFLLGRDKLYDLNLGKSSGRETSSDGRSSIVFI